MIIITPAALSQLEQLAAQLPETDTLPWETQSGYIYPALSDRPVAACDEEHARSYLVAAANAVPNLLAYIRALEQVARQAQVCLATASERAARRPDGQEYCEWVFDGLQHELLRLELDSLVAAGYGEGSHGTQD